MRTKYGFNTTKQRSRLMSKIHSQNTKPELLFRKVLWNFGIRYRINVSYLPGKPDIVINKYKIAIFIDGEFWHGFQWKIKKKKIKANRQYWIPKIENNIKRDIKNIDELTKLGWKVFRFWENDIKKDCDNCIKKIFHYIQTLD